MKVEVKQIFNLLSSIRNIKVICSFQLYLSFLFQYILIILDTVIEVDNFNHERVHPSSKTAISFEIYKITQKKNDL